MITPAAIIEAVSAYYRVPVVALRGADRSPAISWPRAVGMYLTRELSEPPMSYPRIGSFYGGKDHSSVMAAHAKVTERLASGGFGSMRHLTVAEEIAEVRETIDAGAAVWRRRELELRRDFLQQQLAEIQAELAQLPPATARAAAPVVKWEAA